jgi:phosphonate transport system substrate-binding protein
MLWLAQAAAAQRPLTLGVSESLPYYQPEVMALWGDYLQERLGRRVEMVHRPSHNDIFHLLVRGRLDFAWVCPEHYRQHRQDVELLATPLYQGRPRFRILLLAPAASKGEIDSLPDLKDKVAAFVEPDTNFGNGLIKQALAARGLDPDHFFRRVFYTGDHAKVVYAVAGGLAHGGAVVDRTFDLVTGEDPALKQRLRVIWQSAWRPLPPIVAARHVDPALTSRFLGALEQMNTTRAGQAVLQRLHFERFVPGEEALYQAAEADAEGGEQAPLRCGP